MKKFICFAVAFLVSVFMFIVTGLFIKLSTGMIGGLAPARFFIIVLYAICALKFALLVIMLIPGKAVLKQMSSGFILADLALLLSSNSSSLTAGIPISLIIVQVLLLLFYMALQGRLWLYKSNTANITLLKMN